MVLKHFLPLVLGVFSIGNIVEVQANQDHKPSLMSKLHKIAKGEKKNELSLTGITEKLKWREPLSANEEEFVRNETTRIEGLEDAFKKTKGTGTALTKEESNFIAWKRLGELNPTIEEILDNGKAYNWGIDLNLILERRNTARKKTKGGDDLSSIVYLYLINKDNIKEKENSPEEKEITEEVRKLNTAALEEIKRLGGSSLTIRAEKKRIAQEVDEKKEKLYARSKLQNLRKTLEAAEASIQKFTKLPLEKIRLLPSLSEWNKIKDTPVRPRSKGAFAPEPVKSQGSREGLTRDRSTRPAPLPQFKKQKSETN